MKQGRFGYAAAAMVGFISLGCEIATAAEIAENNERGFYVGASIGRAEHEVESTSLPTLVTRLSWGAFVQLELNQVRVDEDTDTGWNVTLGYRINKYLAAELSYHDFGEASVTEVYSTVVTVPYALYHNTRYSLNAFGESVSLLGTFPLTSSLNLFARGGVLFVDQKIEQHVTASPPDAFRGVPFSGSRRSGDEIWMAGAGLQWSFASRWATRLEYQLTDNIEGESSSLRDAATTKLEQVSLSVLFDF